ncbi:transketolase [Coprococcus sp. AF27-8]|nr:transketolase [Coprococcus sp. AF27-8]
MIMNSEELAWKIRRHGIEMTHLSGGSHIGAILSVADIIAVLYSGVMNIDPKNPKKMDRDRFILSKGHAGASIYAALAENGFFEVEELKTHYQNGSRLSGHVSHHLPGVDFSTGSLGHGLSAGVGMAYAAKKDGKSHKVYVVLGDGECDEGSVWEAALFANHFRLNNLVAIVDHNHMQSMDFQENTLEIEDFGEKWKAFGWNVIEMDGNSHEELNIAFEQAEKLSKEEAHKPTVIIANTIKGFGVSFMQNDILWHYRFPHEGWEYDCAVAELHKCKPEGVEDPYTPDGIENPAQPTERDDIGNDHTFSYTWDTSYPEKMRRVEAKSGSDEREHRV